MASLDMRRIAGVTSLVSILFLAPVFGAQSARAAGGNRWDRILDTAANREITYGVSLGGDGFEHFSRNAGRNFTPASVSKLFVADSALRHLGPDHRFVTRVKWLESPATPGIAYGVTIVGAGDPSWGMSEYGENLTTRVKAIAAEMHSRKVRSIQGPIRARANDPRWLIRNVPQGWKDEDLTTCDGARAEALNNDINCAKLIIRSLNTSRWESAELTAPVRLKLTYGQATGLSVQRSDDGFLIQGTLNHGSPRTELYLPVPKATGWVLRLLGSAIYSAGIVIDGHDVDPPADAVQRELVIQSPPLREILPPFLKLSLNFVGDAIYQELGRVVGDPGAPDLRVAGLEVMTRDHGDLILLNDGSGLSRTNVTTPRKVHQFLSSLLETPYFEHLWNALAIAGTDGTLRSRMVGTLAAGKFRGKTGTVNGAYNLAGFAPMLASDGKIEALIPFVSLTQAPVSGRDQARATADRLVVELFR